MQVAAIDGSGVVLVAVVLIDRWGIDLHSLLPASGA